MRMYILWFGLVTIFIYLPENPVKSAEADKTDFRVTTDNSLEGTTQEIINSDIPTEDKIKRNIVTTYSLNGNSNHELTETIDISTENLANKTKSLTPSTLQVDNFEQTDMPTTLHQNKTNQSSKNKNLFSSVPTQKTHSTTETLTKILPTRKIFPIYTETIVIDKSRHSPSIISSGEMTKSLPKANHQYTVGVTTEFHNDKNSKDNTTLGLEVRRSTISNGKTSQDTTTLGLKVQRSTISNGKTSQDATTLGLEVQRSTNSNGILKILNEIGPSSTMDKDIHPTEETMVHDITTKTKSIVSKGHNVQNDRTMPSPSPGNNTGDHLLEFAKSTMSVHQNTSGKETTTDNLRYDTTTILTIHTENNEDSYNRFDNDMTTIASNIIPSDMSTLTLDGISNDNTTNHRTVMETSSIGLTTGGEDASSHTILESVINVALHTVSDLDNKDNTQSHKVEEVTTHGLHTVNNVKPTSHNVEEVTTHGLHTVNDGKPTSHNVEDVTSQNLHTVNNVKPTSHNVEEVTTHGLHTVNDVKPTSHNVEEVTSQSLHTVYDVKPTSHNVEEVTTHGLRTVNDVKPTSHNVEEVTSQSLHTVYDVKPTSHNVEEGTSQSFHTVNDIKPTSHNVEEVTTHGLHTVNDVKPTSHNVEEVTSQSLHTVNDVKPTSHNVEEVTSQSLRTVNEAKPTSHNVEEVTTHGLHTVNDVKPTSHNVEEVTTPGLYTNNGVKTSSPNWDYETSTSSNKSIDGETAGRNADEVTTVGFHIVNDVKTTSHNVDKENTIGKIKSISSESENEITTTGTFKPNIPKATAQKVKDEMTTSGLHTFSENNSDMSTRRSTAPLNHTEFDNSEAFTDVPTTISNLSSSMADSSSTTYSTDRQTSEPEINAEVRIISGLKNLKVKITDDKFQHATNITVCYIRSRNSSIDVTKDGACKAFDGPTEIEVDKIDIGVCYDLEIYLQLDGDWSGPFKEKGCTKPKAPGNLEIIGETCSTFTLKVENPSKGEFDKFRITLNGSEHTYVNKSLGDVTSFVLVNLTPGVCYGVEVYSMSNDQESKKAATTEGCTLQCLVTTIGDQPIFPTSYAMEDSENDDEATSSSQITDSYRLSSETFREGDQDHTSGTSNGSVYTTSLQMTTEPLPDVTSMLIDTAMPSSQPKTTSSDLAPTDPIETASDYTNLTRNTVAVSHSPTLSTVNDTSVTSSEVIPSKPSDEILETNTSITSIMNNFYPTTTPVIDSSITSSQVLPMESSNKTLELNSMTTPVTADKLTSTVQSTSNLHSSTVLFETSSFVSMTTQLQSSRVVSRTTPLQTSSFVSMTTPLQPSSVASTSSLLQTSSVVSLTTPLQTSSFASTTTPLQTSSVVSMTTPLQTSSFVSTTALLQSSSVVSMTTPLQPSSVHSTTSPLQSSSLASLSEQPVTATDLVSPTATLPTDQPVSSTTTTSKLPASTTTKHDFTKKSIPTTNPASTTTSQSTTLRPTSTKLEFNVTQIESKFFVQWQDVSPYYNVEVTCSRSKVNFNRTRQYPTIWLKDTVPGDCCMVNVTHQVTFDLFFVQVNDTGPAVPVITDNITTSTELNITWTVSMEDWVTMFLVLVDDDMGRFVKVYNISCTQTQPLCSDQDFYKPLYCTEYVLDSYYDGKLSFNGNHFELAVTGLNPATTYLYTVESHNYFGTSSTQEISVSTMEDVPGPPTNVSVTALSTSTLLVTWSPPDVTNGEVTAYFLSVTNGYQKLVNDSVTYVTLNDLDCWAEYTVCIKARTSAGYGNESCDLGTTNYYVPQSKIINITNGKAAIHLDFAVPCDHPQVNITYNVSYTALDHTCDNQVNITRSILCFMDQSCDLMDLHSYWDYYIMVQETVGHSEGPWSQIVIVKTLASAPGPVRNIIASTVTSNSITVQWENPCFINSNRLWYNVTVNMRSTIIVEDKQLILLPFLAPYTNYTISVVAINDFGSSESVNIQQRTAIAVPNTPQDLTILETHPQRLVIGWSPPRPYPGPTNYTVTVSDEHGATHHCTPGYNQTRCVVEGLEEFWNYTVTVVARTESGPSQPDMLHNVRTAQAAPGKVESLEVFPESNPEMPRQVYVSFSPPSHRNRNGIIKAYYVQSAEFRTKKFISIVKLGILPHQQYSLKVGVPAGILLNISVFAETVANGTEAFKTVYVPVVVDEFPLGQAMMGIAITVIVVIFVIVAVLYRKQMFCFRPATLSPQNDKNNVQMVAVKPTKKKVSFDQEDKRKNRPVKIDRFYQHVDILARDSDHFFSKEYKELKAMVPVFSTEAAESQEARLKNRYSNILPYDHSRVKLLPLDDEEGSDYINANYIPGYNSKREYIATQGPLPSTKDDFWRMIWEQNVSVIVMLTQCIERGKRKCECYWPECVKEPVYFGDLSIEIENESHLPEYVLRTISITLGDVKKRITHFLYLAWPDMGVPSSSESMISLVQTVRSKINPSMKGPMTVHCSAGVGRTGTFIAVDVLLHQLDNDATEIDIFGDVLKLRHHRCNMVQTEDQYIFIHHCINDYIMALVNDTDEEEEVYDGGDEALYQNVPRRH